MCTKKRVRFAFSEKTVRWWSSVGFGRRESASPLSWEGKTKARVLIEASTESEWVARRIEALGHEVIVADPNFVAMYATRSRRVKTDRRDARTLAEACRLGAYRRAHRVGEDRRHLKAQLAVREDLVETRTRYISLIGAVLRRQGLRVPSGD